MYDPPGVGGTHVMYVLTHADNPTLYHRLPAEPHISPVVRGWKEWLKPVGALGFIATLAGAFAHYMAVGPNSTDETLPEVPEKELVEADEKPDQNGRDA
nr:formate dehydrogenase N subunit beta transmembrane domain-containing protein [Acetobacter ascendens]